MYQIRLFGFQLERTMTVDMYVEAPFVLTRQDHWSIMKWIETQAPILFAEGVQIPYEIWVCVGAVPVRKDSEGVIVGVGGSK